MGNSNAQRGTYLEHAAMDLLREAGFFVIRSAGSHGVADLVAVKPGLCLLVQSKMKLALLGSREWTALWLAAQEAGGLPIVAYRPSMRKIAFARLMGPRQLRERAEGLLEAYAI
jgi:Holliday junction resolvase